MRKRLTTILAVLTTVALATGVAWAARPPAELTVADERSVTVADAGQVAFRVDADVLSVVEIHTNPGWVAEAEAEAGRQIQVDFRSGVRRVRFHGELEDGTVRVRVRQDGGSPAPVTEATSGTPSTEVTSATTAASSTTAVEPTAPSTSPATSPSSSPSTSPGPTSTVTTPSTTIPASTSTTGAGTSTTVDDRTSTTVAEPDLAPGSRTHEIPGVATIAIAWADGHLSLVSYTVSAGWTAEVEDQRSDRIRIDFESEEGDARFEARLDGQDLRVEARRD